VVSIVVSNYGEKAQKYLDLCLEAVANLEPADDAVECIVSSSGAYRPTVPNFVKHVHSNKDLNFAECVNQGFETVDPRSRYCLFLSDDTIPTRNSLKNLIAGADGKDVLIAPTSNCDNYFAYVLGFFVPLGDQEGLHVTDRFYRYDDWAPHKQAFMNAKSLYQPGFIFRTFITGYAFFISMALWRRLGGFDTRFVNGQEDVDLCLRARQLGVMPAVALDVLIWHFGGVTTTDAVKDEQRQKNEAYFEQKWGFKAPT